MNFARIRAREWSPGDQLPTESLLCAEYAVSRSTVRQALKVLESQGFTVTRHGRGTFVADDATIHAGIQELTSLSETIAGQGRVPAMRYKRRVLRPATGDERERLALRDNADVLDIRRAILADRQVVAYSYDVLSTSVLPHGFRCSQLRGSVFAFLERNSGIVAARAVARVHAVQSDTVRWDDAPQPRLYVLLDQLHYDVRDRPFMHSRTYFVEGHFNFVVLRTRRSVHL